MATDGPIRQRLSGISGRRVTRLRSEGRAYRLGRVESTEIKVRTTQVAVLLAEKCKARQHLLKEVRSVKREEAWGRAGVA